MTKLKQNFLQLKMNVQIKSMLGFIKKKIDSDCSKEAN